MNKEHHRFDFDDSSTVPRLVEDDAGINKDPVGKNQKRCERIDDSNAIFGAFDPCFLVNSMLCFL